ncbi:MAG: heparinase II/III family protein [Tissierellia bacterium]|nr:heparinase II/III family protein [Tissierellia bacterium]
MMIKSLINEYGLPWVFNRLLYSAKLKMMRTIPSTEKFFEKAVAIKRIDIFDIDVHRLEQFLIDLPSEKKKEIITIADKASEGKIKVFSSIELDYGNPINWHYNPITKAEVDKTLKWYKIPDFDPERGDIKVIWEASRFVHFFYFARAYLITKEQKYYDAFSYQLKNWIKDNRYSYGANYKCGQEATLRMINALITYSVFRSCGLYNQIDVDNLCKLVEGSYKKVLSNFFYAHKCIKNNHTISEITGLIVGAWCSHDKKSLEQAYRLLDKEIEKQFFKDGGYIQHSFNYQRFALQLMEFILKISKKTTMYMSDRSKSLIKSSVLLMYQMQDDTGDVPNYGSNDGALIFPVTSCGYRDFSPVINTLYALLEGKRIYNTGDYDEELLWFIDKKIEEIPITEIKRISSEFKQSGFYSLRYENSFLMVILQNFKTRPAQMDQLHIDIWHKGKNILCDSGTYSYATDIGKQLALTAAHNTVKVDNNEQMKKHGPFLIYDWTSSRDVIHNSNSFSGTMVSKNGYKHTRDIKITSWGYKINDKVIGNASYCEFYFHTPFEVKIIQGGFELLDKDVVLCKVEVDSKGIVLNKAYRSLYYLKKEEINCASIRCNMNYKKCSIKFDIRLIN